MEKAPSPRRKTPQASGCARGSDARALLSVVSHSNQPAPRSRQTAARSGAFGADRKHLLQLVGRRDFELIVAAVGGLLVRSPALKDRRMPEAIALEMVVLHFGNPLDAQRLPRHVLAGAPAALRSRHAARLRLGPPPPPPRPFAPGMVLQRVLPQWRQFLHELLAHGHRE